MSQKSELTLVYELSSDCECSYYDEETGEDLPSPECSGCYQDNLDNIKFSVLEKWMETNSYELDTPILIIGSNLNWDRRSGYKLSSPASLISNLTLDSDFTLRFYANESFSELEVSRSSHDEYGASFRFVPAEFDEYGEPII